MFRFLLIASVWAWGLMPLTLGAQEKSSGTSVAAWETESSLDHRRLIASLDAGSLARGRSVYESFCVNCHGQDGVTAQVPPAPAFASGPLKFGEDPYSMFLTLTRGNGLMVSQEWLSVEERYDVIHYIRERFVKRGNQAMTHVDGDYLARLPRHVPPPSVVAQNQRDHGPAVASQFKTNAVSALSILLEEDTAVSYNLHDLSLNAVWQGGFLDLERTGHTQLRGEGLPEPAGQLMRGLQTWFWGHEGRLDYPRHDLLPRGPLPEVWFHYHGHYLHEGRAVLAYQIDGREVLEMPEKPPRFSAMAHVLRIGPGKNPLVVCVGAYTALEDNWAGTFPRGGLKFQPAGESAPVRDTIGVIGSKVEGELGEFVAAAVLGETAGVLWDLSDPYRLALHIGPGQAERRVEVLRYSGRTEAQLQSFADFSRHREKTGALQVDLGGRLRGGPARWPEVLETSGKKGPEHLAYTLDTLTLPESTPWNTWFRTSALDFLSDGRMVLSTYVGDIWLVGGIDEDLRRLSWKRFAAGLYEPFGVKVKDDQIYVTCKDRLVRLHDFNADGEADFYESFHADDDVSLFFHAFNFDLQTDAEGNFYYAKAGQYTDYRLPGALVKVSPDGRTREIVCTGFRTPNGTGILPDGRSTVSDNQGNWMPASKISLVRPGGFYGYSQTHVGGGRFGTKWAPDGGRIDHRRVVPPAEFDQPLIWMPQEFDNSSGGQVWAGDPRWGPLSGRLLHTSFGKGWLYYLMFQEAEEQVNGAIVRLPLDFVTGIHRARVNPKDGQVYATGLNGWNAGGRQGLADGGVQRVRFTGAPAWLITNATVLHDGLEFFFNFELDGAVAADPAHYAIEQWNYKWRAGYGSEQWSVTRPNEKGRDRVKVAEARVASDRRSVRLLLPVMQVCNQMHARLRVRSSSGHEFEEEIYLTINYLPRAP